MGKFEEKIFGLKSLMQLSSLAEHFKSLLHQPGLTNALPFGPDKEDALCTFTPVTSAEVRTLLKNLVTDKAAGPDGIRPKELKHSCSTDLRLAVGFF